MAKRFRIKCPNCGELSNLPGNAPCPKCGAPISVETQGAIALYRMGSFVGVANGFGIYINNVAYGAIGNRESLIFPLPYGTYQLHVVCGMNRKCNDPVITLSPEDPYVCMKVHKKMGFVQYSFILERVDPSTMPQD